MFKTIVHNCNLFVSQIYTYTLFNSIWFNENTLLFCTINCRQHTSTMSFYFGLIQLRGMSNRNLYIIHRYMFCRGYHQNVCIRTDIQICLWPCCVFSLHINFIYFESFTFFRVFFFNIFFDLICCYYGVELILLSYKMFKQFLHNFYMYLVLYLIKFQNKFFSCW